MAKKVNADAFCEMYVKFRQEIDTMAAPLIYDDYTVIRPIKADDGKVVGILAGYKDYIDMMYIDPEHRRKGLGRKAAVDFILEDDPCRGVRLGILNSNDIAKAFWEECFELRHFSGNDVDTSYQIAAVRNYPKSESGFWSYIFSDGYKVTARGFDMAELMRTEFVHGKLKKKEAV